MRIGIDARLLEIKMTGVGRYLIGLVDNFPICDDVNEYFLFTYKKEGSFQNITTISTLFFSPSGVFRKILSPIWMNFILPFFLRKYRIDILFSPNQLLPLTKTHTKNVMVIHDLFHLVDKSFHPLFFRVYSGFFIGRSIKKSNFIITISEASKKDIQKLLNVSENRIGVTYEAAEEKFTPRILNDLKVSELREKYNLPKKFILYVGVIEERKNIHGIIKIADFLLEKGIDVPVVLVGRIGHNGKKYLETIKNRKNMLYVGFVDDADLPFLYNLASVFIFPSFYEGFGIPPLEAMQSGVPVISSNASSLPEVVGGGVLLDPSDYLGFVDAIIKILSDDDFRNQLIKNGLTQAEKFSAKSMTCKTVDIFNRIR